MEQSTLVVYVEELTRDRCCGDVCALRLQNAFRAVVSESSAEQRVLSRKRKEIAKCTRVFQWIWPEER